MDPSDQGAWCSIQPLVSNQACSTHEDRRKYLFVAGEHSPYSITNAQQWELIAPLKPRCLLRVEQLSVGCSASRVDCAMEKYKVSLISM